MEFIVLGGAIGYLLAGSFFGIVVGAFVGWLLFVR